MELTSEDFWDSVQREQEKRDREREREDIDYDTMRDDAMMEIFI
jgi:hypothetical protein